jgi:hypothetical protein
MTLLAGAAGPPAAPALAVHEQHGQITRIGLGRAGGPVAQTRSSFDRRRIGKQPLPPASLVGKRNGNTTRLARR